MESVGPKGVGVKVNRGVLAELGRRCRIRWLAKTLGIATGMSAFFVVYLWLLKHPTFSVTTMPLAALDHWLPFQPEWLWIYASLWVYVPLLPIFLETLRELSAYAIGCAVLSLLGFGIFFFWPTVVPARPNDWANHPGFSFLQSVDASGNACPSMHVAFAVFTAYRLESLLREIAAGLAWRIGNWLWCVAIVYSTLATRQHVMIDIAAGTVLAIFVARFFARASRTEESPAS